ncbi:Fic family protein [Adlercreutzia equolifaciens]|uniref:Fic family protein n=1 Tax=Adlercreutzia equolifaciens TaxID=446660 RepID=UPI00059F22DC|nr:Fic family protein [Adlercreutzia equolifaciens]RFT81421.1 Fic family protein [Adlercreutzia equolifaciens]
MGVYLNCFWQLDSGGMNKAERMGGPYHPYLPDTLADYELLLSPSCASAVADAQEALAKLELFGSRVDTEPLARMMLRAEAVSSSRIEGLEMPAGRLLEYEELDRLGVDHRLDSTEAQILGNLHTLVDGLARAEAASPLTVEEVCELNRVLLAGTRLADRGGVIRAELPPIATAAIAHAQLETIHPFADGNGRAGRALVHLILKKGGTTRVTVPPISLLLATDRERYIANLAAFRFEGDDETKRREAVNGWVEYFARTTCEACSRASAFEETLLAIREGWRAKVPFREGSAGAQLLDILLGTPVISIKTAQDLTGKSYPAARTAVGELAAAGILRKNAKNRKSGIFEAGDVVEAFNAYERSLATISGDTAAEKPKRPVPQRGVRMP